MYVTQEIFISYDMIPTRRMADYLIISELHTERTGLLLAACCAAASSKIVAGIYHDDSFFNLAINLVLTLNGSEKENAMHSYPDIYYTSKYTSYHLLAFFACLRLCLASYFSFFFFFLFLCFSCITVCLSSPCPFVCATKTAICCSQQVRIL